MKKNKPQTPAAPVFKPFREYLPQGWEWWIVVVGALYRYALLWHPVEGDEAYTFIAYARYPLGYIVSNYSTPNNHILHSVLMRLTYLLFGPAEWAVRLPVFTAGVGVIVLTFVLALKVIPDRRVARLATLLVAFSSHLAFYSACGRGYELEALFTLGLTLIAFSERMQRRPRTAVSCTVLLGFCLLYTIPSGFLFLAPFYVYLWFFRPESLGGRSQILTAALWTAFLVGGAYWPLRKDLVAFSQGQQTAVGSAEIRPFLAELYREWCEGSFPQAVFWVLPLLGLAFIPAGSSRWFFLVCVFPYLIIALALHPWKPFLLFLARSYDLLYPLLDLLAAIGVWKGIDRLADRPLVQRWTRCALVGVFAVSMLAGVSEAIWNQIAPFDPDERARYACRDFVKSAVKDLAPGEYVRGNPTCDGVAIYYASQYALFDYERLPIRVLLLFSDKPADALKFFYNKNEIASPQYFRLPVAIRRKQMVVLYRIAPKT